MLSIQDYHNAGHSLMGYQQVYSERGRLSVLPDNIHQAINLSDRPIPQVFRSRHSRPHRIHIARVTPERGLEDPISRSRTSTVIFGKLADSRASAKRFLRSFISHDSSKSDHPPSLTSNRTTDRSGAGGRPQSGTSEGRRRPHLDTMRPNLRNSIASPIGGVISRSSFPEELRSSSPVKTGSTVELTQKLPEEKPLASGNGVSISIALAEPVLFLQGFDHTDLQSNRSTAMLRGSLHLNVTKPSKIKSVSLRFRGRATTKWPEGIPPKKQEFEETLQQMNHIWPFFNAQFPQAEHGTMADQVELQTSPIDLPNLKTRSTLESFAGSPASTSNGNLSSKELKRLSLQATQSRSFSKGEAQPGGPTVAQRGFRTFNPGHYVYNFELPIDSHMPETIDVDLGSVKYELEAIVERAGAFKANLMGTKEVVFIRTPAEGSLEQVEPIAISRNWEDQMHYDIVISGKSFPLGAQVPIAFKLTPLAKVRCHRIKVFVTESIEYYCNNKRVHRMEPSRKVQLFEKRSDGPANSTFPGSSMRIVSGGGVPYDLRAAAARGEEITPPDPTNLLGNLESDRNIGPTEMEFNVQLPSCSTMRDKDRASRLHFDTTYSNIQVHHWIKIVLRLSRPDTNDPTKRRHFEISIDSPFHILSCRATQANISLPAYSSPENETPSTRLYECGCPGAPLRRNSPTYVPTLNSLSSSRPHASSTASTATTASSTSTISPTTSGSPTSPSTSSLSRVTTAGLQRPAAAHTQGPFAQARPMHIIRTPSFLPPAFDSDSPPPPLETPPPQYADIASPTSGLADYFARLADRYDDDSGSASSGGSTAGDVDSDGRQTPRERDRSRVEVPTPGAVRAARSMDEPRAWLPLGVGAPPAGEAVAAAAVPLEGAATA